MGCCLALSHVMIRGVFDDGRSCVCRHKKQKPTGLWAFYWYRQPGEEVGTDSPTNVGLLKGVASFVRLTC